LLIFILITPRLVPVVILLWLIESFFNSVKFHNQKNVPSPIFEHPLSQRSSSYGVLFKNFKWASSFRNVFNRLRIFKFLKLSFTRSITFWGLITFTPKDKCSRLGEPSRIYSRNRFGISLCVNFITFQDKLIADHKYLHVLFKIHFSSIFKNSFISPMIPSGIFKIKQFLILTVFSSSGLLFDSCSFNHFIFNYLSMTFGSSFSRYSNILFHLTSSGFDFKSVHCGMFAVILFSPIFLATDGSKGAVFHYFTSFPIVNLKYSTVNSPSLFKFSGLASDI